MHRLAGKVALITGAGGGIGAATARLFAREGARVALNDVRPESLAELSREIAASGGEALALAGSVTVKAEVEQVVQSILQRWGRLDILINNAGVIRDALLPRMSEQAWEEVLAVNLKGSFLCAQAASVPMAAQGGGRIVNTASISALGNIGQANYAAAKSGVIGLTRTLALELARHNITVNCVAPGFTETPMTAGIPAQLKDEFLQRIPLRRMAQPVDIAAAHLFLAGDEASYITGQVLFVDGGISVGI